MKKVIVVFGWMFLFVFLGRAEAVDQSNYTGWSSSVTVSTQTLYDAIIASGIGRGILLHTVLFYPPHAGCFVEFFDSLLSSDTSIDVTNSKRVWYATAPYQPIWDVNMSSGLLWNKVGGCAAEVLYLNPYQ